MIEAALEALEATPGRVALTGLDARGVAAYSRTSAETLASVGAWQRVLRDRGSRPGDRIAIDLPRGPELLPAHLAALASGLCVVPINPALSQRERERVLERAEATAVLADESERADTGSAPVLAQPDLERPALLIFTSGTTGEPKGVPLSLTNLAANLEALAQTWSLRPDESLLHVLPAHHVHGLVLALYGSVCSGMPIVMAERFDAELCLNALRDHHIDVFMGVPTMYHRMIAAAQSTFSADLPSVRLFISGSAPLAQRDFDAFAARFGSQPLERYGLSETLIVTSNPQAGPREPGRVGHALPHTSVELAADGEVRVKGPGVMRGYWRDAEANELAFDGEFFRTGDLGEFDAELSLRLTGRKKELIIVGGSNVLPGEVEQALGGDRGIEELAVAGLPDADRGEVVAAFIVARPGEPQDEIEARLRSAADAELAAYKRPRVYRFVAELPRNAMGKINRKALR
jgi:malonyl-CoA/methylmalonyl-CoA synthetase